jgi:hypothetical protein
MKFRISKQKDPKIQKTNPTRQQQYKRYVHANALRIPPLITSTVGYPA